MNNISKHTNLVVPPFRVEVFTSMVSYQLNLRVKSDFPIDVWVVPSKEDVNMITEGEDFSYDPQMSKRGITNFSASGYFEKGTQIVLANRSEHPAKVEFWAEEQKKLTINGAKVC